MVSIADSLRPVVISGPSGSGKSTLLKKLFANHSDVLGFSVSHTTRKPRLGEINGKEYHFVSEEYFKDMIQKNMFLEWAYYSSCYYGTSINEIDRLCKGGRIPILDIDLCGVKSIKNLCDVVPARFVFIRTSNFETLERRLRGRGTETEESILRRLESAKQELDYAHSDPNPHDLIIINDDLERSYCQLEDFIFHRHHNHKLSGTLI